MKGNIVSTYIRNSFEELTKITWPTKNQAIRLTIIVLVMCIIIAFVLGIIDYIFMSLYEYVLTLTENLNG